MGQREKKKEGRKERKKGSVDPRVPTAKKERKNILGVNKCVCILRSVWLSMTLWTVAHQAPLPMEVFRQEYWIGLLFPPPRGFSQPRNQTLISRVSCIAGRLFTTKSPGNPQNKYIELLNVIPSEPSGSKWQDWKSRLSCDTLTGKFWITYGY